MRRTLIAITLVFPLLIPATGRPGLLDPLWDFLSWMGSEAPTKEGPGIDPWGQSNGAQPPQPQSEAGPGWDPFG